MKEGWFRPTSRGFPMLLTVIFLVFLSACRVENSETLPPTSFPVTTPSVSQTLESPYADWLLATIKVDEDTTDLGLISESGELRLLGIQDLAPSNPAWAPDWSKISFVSGHALYLINPNCASEDNCSESALKLLDLFPNRIMNPSWSLDGRWLAFEYLIPSAFIGYDVLGTAILGMGEDNIDERKLVGLYGYLPSWTEIGGENYIVLYYSREQSEGEIVLKDLLGNEIFLLDTLEFGQRFLDYEFSPSGEFAVLKYEDVLLLELRSRTTSSLPNGFAFAWSPDETKLAFLRRDTGDFSVVRLVVYDIGTGIQKTIFQGPIEELAWAP